MKVFDPHVFDTEEFEIDPFPSYAHLREEIPVFRDRVHNRWILTRYEGVLDAFRDNEHFDRALYDPNGLYEFGSAHPFGPNILEFGNSDRHRWMRNIVANQFVGQGLTAFIPVIERIASELIERHADSREMELLGEVSTQFPIRVISNMLGLPREDEPRFVGWYQDLIAGLSPKAESAARGMRARDEMWEYLGPIIDDRRAHPRDDLLTRLVEAELDGQRMSTDEVKGFIALLLAAGGDTTDKAIADMWFHMLYTRPDQFEDVKRDPELWENVFAEMMRFDPVVHAQTRYTTKEVALDGKVLPRGAMVTLFLAAGNRDPRVFNDPDTFDIHRTDMHMGPENRSAKYRSDLPGHLGFGVGQHFCMGYRMARQEAVIASKRLLELMGNPRPKYPDHPGLRGGFPDTGGFRAPAELWIEW